MAGIIKRTTTNFVLGIPRFDLPGWGAAFERNMDIIDAVLSTAGVVSGIVGEWLNNTVYAVDNRVVDPTDNTVWQAAVAHTSALTGSFAADRAANPTYWDLLSPGVIVREQFVTGTGYFAGDFIYDNAEDLAGIALAPFTGGANLRTHIASLGVIYDLKADLAAIPTIQANILALQNGSQLHALTAAAITDADEVGFWEDVAGLLRKITWTDIKTTLASLFLRYDTTQSLTGPQKNFAKTNIGAIGVVRTQQFTANGTYTPHANMLYCIIECIGSGGAGGGCVGVVGNYTFGGGGSSGGRSLLITDKATIGASKAVTVGAAGAAGAAGNNPGGAGNSTSVGALCIALGGAGGPAQNGANTPATPALGAAGGTGIFLEAGSPGNPGGWILLTSGFMLGGGGGDGPAQGGGRATVNAAGAAATAAGAGGGGGSVFNTTGTVAGGAGAAGIVNITEFCSE